jgi:hypothetical protein
MYFILMCTFFARSLELAVLRLGNVYLETNILNYDIKNMEMLDRP